jgi:RNA polymerase sigma factor (sigma-70 family)
MIEAGLLSAFMNARPALARFLAARGASHPEAEDLLQELFIKLQAPQTGPVAEPQAYLYRMAHNLMLDRHRSESRLARRGGEWSASHFGASGDKDQQPSIETVLIDRERLKAVTDAIATLPDRTIEIFRCYRIDGESQKAIASRVGISVSAVEKHLQRAYRVVIDARRQLAVDSEDARRLQVKGADCDD